MRRAQKTHVLSKIEFKCRTRRNLTRQVSMTCCTLFGTHRNAHVKQDCLKSCTLFGTHGKRTCRVRLTTTLELYSAHRERIC